MPVQANGSAAGAGAPTVRRRRRGRVLARIALYGGAVFVGIPLAFAYVMTRAYPAAFQAPPPRGHEAVALRSDGLRLRAWLARGRSDKAAFVLVHGLGDTIESYLEHARHLESRGHSVLLVDLRGHGGSEGNVTTLGGLESHDVRAGMEWLRRAGLAPRGLGLMGHSMGAVAVLLAAADQTDVRVVVAEAPFDTYRHTIAHHARLLYHLPEWAPLIPIAIAFAEWRAGFDADAIDAVAAARRIRAPLLLIADGLDPRMPETVVRPILDAHAGPHRLWVAAHADHVGAILDPQWQPVVGGFLEECGL